MLSFFLSQASLHAHPIKIITFHVQDDCEHGTNINGKSKRMKNVHRFQTKFERIASGKQTNHERK